MEKKTDLLKRHFLHAHKLGFDLPASGKHVEFKAELPEDLQGVLNRISS
jgi:23S rRNA pseudouridine1911/1915/1917 synthase